MSLVTRRGDREVASVAVAATECVPQAARAAFQCATDPIKRALRRGFTADEQLDAVAEGYSKLVTSAEGRELSMLDLETLPALTSNKVGRYRHALAKITQDVLEAGASAGEFCAGDSKVEARRWILLADALPRLLGRAPVDQARATATWVFESLASTYRPERRSTLRSSGVARHPVSKRA